MAHSITIELGQTWETLDDAVAYFKALANDLNALKGFQDPPMELYLDVERGKEATEHIISIRNL